MAKWDWRARSGRCPTPKRGVAEATRLGFTRVIVPYHNLKALGRRTDVELIGVRTIRDAYEALGG